LLSPLAPPDAWEAESMHLWQRVHIR